MTTLDNNIKKAKNIIQNKSTTSLFFNIYPFTTENIKEYYNLLDFENKDILTVASSGDHTLNLYLENSKSIDFFDINPFSKYYFDLKFAAIKSLNHKEYLKFFCQKEPNYCNINTSKFSEELFSRIKLEGESKRFWEALYNDYTGYTIRDSNLFTKDEPLLNSIIKINSYLTKKNYSELSTMTKKEHIFYNTDLAHLPNQLTKTYDIIMLSNIPHYIETDKNIKTLKRFKIIIEELSKYLKKDGIILLSYLYDIYFAYIYKMDKSIPSIYKINTIKELFGKESIYEIEINSIQGIQNKQKTPIKDGIIIYKKGN